MAGKEPKTPEQWQEAVDAAAACRAIADCKMYGLLEGGPTIDVRRCDDILARRRAKNILPSRPKRELAIGMIAALNDASNGARGKEPR